MKKTFPIIAFAVAVLSAGCSVEKVDANYAAKIAGTYIMKSYRSEVGASSPGANDKILLVRKDDKHVVLTIDYADPASKDVESDNVSVTESGGKYTLNQGFTNATLTGTVTSAGFLDMKIEYTDSDYVMITAQK
jgi:hypothetical protein